MSLTAESYAPAGAVEREAAIAPRDCFHDDQRLVYKTAGKNKDYTLQCVLCGSEMVGARQEPTLQERIAAKPFDWALRNNGMRKDYESKREEENGAWRRAYEAHLSSPAWKELRRQVLFRCQGICEGCRKAPALHVHHLTYDRMGHEMLFDLVGVCAECHQGIHPDKQLTKQTNYEIVSTK